MGVGAVVVLVLVGLGCAVLVSALVPKGGGTELARPEPSASAAAEGPVMLVHVLGEVVDPGLYELSEGDRVVDAVAAAGGFTEAAEQGGVNLARPLTDGEQLVVPAVGQAPAPGVVSDGRVNLNTADQATIETLPRVGPALAARIIAWRDANGGFASVDDLLNVTGIGQKTFDGLRDLVTT